MNKRKFKEILEGKAIVIVKPRNLFLDWVNDIIVKSEIGLPISKIYNSKGSSWVVKNPSIFRSYEDFQSYIDSKKPDMLAIEVNCFYRWKHLINVEITYDMFDQYFSIEVFDELIPIEELS